MMPRMLAGMVMLAVVLPVGLVFLVLGIFLPKVHRYRYSGCTASVKGTVLGTTSEMTVNGRTCSSVKPCRGIDGMPADAPGAPCGPGLHKWKTHTSISVNGASAPELVVKYEVGGHEYRVSGPKYTSVVNAGLLGDKNDGWDPAGDTYVIADYWDPETQLVMPAHFLLDYFPVGTAINVMYDPADPGVAAVLRCPKDMTGLMRIIFIITGAVITAMSLIMLIVFV